MPGCAFLRYTPGMTVPKLRLVLLALLLLPCHPVGAADTSANLVLVTMDGVRWQEVFGGVDVDLIEDERYTRNPELLKKTYWREQRTERRKQLFPFLWSVIAAQGVLVGDRVQESYMEVSNRWWFSYPGYNEILTGRADRAIDSNDKNWNPNVTFLEVLNRMEGFKNRVLAFGSWDVFPYIIKTQRSISSMALSACGMSLAGSSCRLASAVAAICDCFQ